MSDRPKAAAFFDLDRTLIDVNSGLLYAKYERRNGRITAYQMARSLFWTLMYHLSLIDMEKAYAHAVAHYRGVDDQLLADRTREWFADEVAHRIQPGAQAALDWHRAQEHPLVLLTNSSCYASREAERAWDLDDWIANVFPTDALGRLTGQIDPPLCYGRGKVVRARRWAAEHGVSLDASWFYSDSYSDRPMLEAVGHPGVVQPDPRLRRLAKRRGWPLLDWSKAPVDGYQAP